MIKKKYTFCFLFLIILISFFSVVEAERFASLTSASESVSQFSRNPQETTTDYLKKEWTKILSNNTIFGPWIKWYEKSAPVLDPVFQYTIGIKTGFNWLFVLTLVIAITFVIYSYRIFSAFSVFQNHTQIILTVMLTLCVGNFQIFVNLSKWTIVTITTVANSWITQLLIILFIIAVFTLLSYFSKAIKKRLQEILEERERERERRARENTIVFGETVGNALRGVAGGTSGGSSGSSSRSSGSGTTSSRSSSGSGASGNATPSTEKFSYLQGMRRGGEKSAKSRFVSKKSTERYSRMFGDEAAKKRFEKK